MTFTIPNLGDQLCTIITWSHTSITCKSPNGRGAHIPVRVFTNDARSAMSSINYYIPTVSSVIGAVAGTAGLEHDLYLCFY